MYESGRIHSNVVQIYRIVLARLQRLAVIPFAVMNENRLHGMATAGKGGLMFRLEPGERRQARRQMINRMAKIQLGAGTLPRDCLITDISTGGVRLHVEGFDVPDDFVLMLSGDDMSKEASYRVVWRLGHEIGARFVGLIRRNGTARN